MSDFWTALVHLVWSPLPQFLMAVATLVFIGQKAITYFSKED